MKVLNSKKRKINKSKVMRKAWELLKAIPMDQRHDLIWSECLHKAWNIEKNGFKHLNIETLYSEYYKDVLNIVNYQLMGKDKLQAEEIANDVFIKLDSKLDQYDPQKSDIKGYILGCAKNAAIDYGRSKANKNKAKIDQIDSYVNTDGKEYYQIESVSYVDDIESKETQSTILKAFSKLNPTEKKIAKLYFIEEYQYNEISEELNISMGNVKVSINRLRKKLQNSLQSTYKAVC